MKCCPVVALSLTLWLPLTASPARIVQETPAAGAASVTVTVDASHPWIDSGLTVRKDERLLFHASGSIRWGTDPDQVAGPEGHGAKPGKLGAGGLIARVGSTGKPFAVGNRSTPIAMPKSGKLFLGINDFVFKDNAGSFTVTISHARSGDPN